MKIKIESGRVIDPANKIDQVKDIYIADGLIVSIGSVPESFSPDKIIDAKNQIVCPGLVDMRVRLREPGFEYKATIASETQAAAASGITTLCCPPDTLPVIDTPAVLELIRHRANEAGFAKIVAIGALTKNLAAEKISEMYALKKAGCVGVGNALKSVTNGLMMRRAMEYALSQDLTVFLHAEDSYLRGEGCAHEGPVSIRLGLAGIPEVAETIAVSRELALIELTGVKAHFSGLSTSTSVRMISRAQFEGLPVTADVAVNHLYLTDTDIGEFDTSLNVRPPFRTQRDRDGLRAALTERTISAICSDHQPHETDAKLGTFGDAEPGISGLETLLPLVLRLVDDKLMSLSEAIECVTINPAEILGINAGTLSVGECADVCIFSLDNDWRLTAESMWSEGKNTPYLGWEFSAKVSHTLLDGRIVYQDRQH